MDWWISLGVRKKMVGRRILRESPISCPKKESFSRRNGERPTRSAGEENGGREEWKKRRALFFAEGEKGESAECALVEEKEWYFALPLEGKRLAAASEGGEKKRQPICHFL